MSSLLELSRLLRARMSMWDARQSIHLSGPSSYKVNMAQKSNTTRCDCTFNK